MKRLLQYLLGRRATMVVNVQKFGELMTWEQLQAVFRNRGQDPMFRAIGQLLEFQRQNCQKAVQDKSNLAHGQTAYEAGAAGGAGDLIAMLEELQRGNCQDREMKQWFSAGRGDKEAES